MKVLVTGGAGFIGSHIVDRLIKDGHNVTVVDNMSSGKKEFIKHHFDKDNFTFIELDLLEFDKLKDIMKGQESVYHIAANPDIKFGTEHTDFDLKNGVIATHNVLEAMRLNDVKKIVFSSSSVVYGEASEIPTPEDYGPLMPISLYGASKLGAEAYITAYCGTFGLQSWIFRFANIVGERGTHGVIVDFIRKLRENSQKLEILGDGKQKKSYLLVKDCVDAIMFAVENSNDPVNIFNLGVENQTSVIKIGEIVSKELELDNVEFKYTGGTRGWKGDVPNAMLATKKLNNLGWNASISSDDAVSEAVKKVLKEI